MAIVETFVKPHKLQLHTRNFRLITLMDQKRLVSSMQALASR